MFPHRPTVMAGWSRSEYAADLHNHLALKNRYSSKSLLCSQVYLRMFEDAVGRELSEFEVAAAVVSSIKLFEPREWSYHVIQEVLGITNITSASLALAETALLKALNLNMFPVEIVRYYQDSMQEENHRIAFSQ